MTVAGAAGFWSYSHQDNERDGNGICRLARHIMDEFALVTGETLTLFLDHKDIQWGEEWRRRIDASLAETTFFIPIITPLYFKRSECRRELLSFVGQARSLGAIELVMPILYVDVPGFTEESTDEACALVARMQYVDWRKIRLMAEDSAQYREGVNSLAVRLAEIADRYEQHSSLHESEEKAMDGNYVEQAAEEAAEEEEGLLDIIAEVEPKVLAWKEIIDSAEIIGRQIDILQKDFVEKMQKAERSGFSSGALLNFIRAFCREYEPLERRSIAKAEAYSSATVELDPSILLLIRMLNAYPEFIRNLPTPLISVEDAYETVRDDEAKNKKKDAESKKMVNRYKGMSKDLTRIVRLLDAEDRLISDGNSILENWHQKIQAYLEESSSRSVEAQEVMSSIESLFKMAKEAPPDIAGDAESRPGRPGLLARNDEDDSMHRGQ
jgi:hypothetical protein